jgi:hypothetical protein
MSTDNEREPDEGANPDEYISDGRTGESYVLGQTFDAKPVAMLDASSGDDIRRLTRTKLSAVPVTEPGADPADVAAVPPPEILAGAARALRLEAARWARLRVGEELVCEWRL